MTHDKIWFYIGTDDERRGPVNRDDLLDMVRMGAAGEEALVWREGFQGWRAFRDVTELRNPAAAQQPAAPAPAKPSPPRQARPTPTPAGKPAKAVRAQPMKTKAYLAIGVGCAITAIAVASALYTSSRPDSPAVTSQGAALHQAEVAQATEAVAEVEAGPVRVKNPFDASEVFEFPPGTSETQARHAVADLLMKRAMERRSKPRKKVG